MDSNTILYLPDLYLAEKEFAFFAAEFLKVKCNAVPWNTTGLLYKQPEAVINSCTKSISILTGPPGTGKTTTLKMIVESFEKAGLSGRIVTPTGKAAKRADEVVNQGRTYYQKIPCQTIQSALEFDVQIGEYAYNRQQRFKEDFFILEEFSMTDIETARDFIEAVDPRKTRIVFCGDQYQLPSVGPGNLARDLIFSNIFSQVELDKVLRTGPNSGITYNANLILRGQSICKHDDENVNFEDFFFVERQTEQNALDSIVDWVAEKIPKSRNLDSLKDIHVIAPGKNGICGTKNLNAILREKFNPGQKETLNGLKVGDKVINRKNNKKLKIVNGDVGFVTEVVKGKGGSHLTVDFGVNAGPNLNGITEMKSETLDYLQLAYCTTVHSSQGSEFPVVIIPMFEAHTMLLTRNLIYTGLTRGRQLAMFVGHLKALRRAIANTSSQDRRTGLVKALREYAKVA